VVSALVGLATGWSSGPVIGVQAGVGTLSALAALVELIRGSSTVGEHRGGSAEQAGSNPEKTK
jgi:hypothetical protein